MAIGGDVSMDELTDVCKCSLCKDIYKDPRMLPCLHRYCRDCLLGMIDSKEQEQKIICPECTQNFVLPKGGVNELKSDVQMKHITEHLRRVTSFTDGHRVECCVCAKISKVSAYCYTCDDFLCRSCYVVHPSTRCFKDHECHVFSSKDLTSKNTTFEKIASGTKDPRCKTHPQTVAQLCCVSCGNLPICLVCAHGDHKIHNTADVIKVAKLETGKLKEKLTPLHASKEEVNKMKEIVQNVEQGVEKSFSRRKKSSQFHYEMELKEIESKLRRIEEKVQTRKMEVDNVHTENVEKLNQAMETEINALNKKYEKLFEKEESDYKTELGILDAKLKEEKCRLNGKRTLVDKTFREWEMSTDSEKVRALNEICSISHHFDSTFMRLENLTATAGRVVASNHHWTAVECIPVIRAAIEPLVEDAKKQFPELMWLPETPHPSAGMILLRRNRVSISQVEEMIVDLERIRKQGFHIRDMTNTMKDAVVISGDGKQKQSHITLVDLSAEIQNQREFDSPLNHPRRFCTFLSDHRIATVCEPDEIRIIDFRNFTNLWKSISDVNSDRSNQHVVSCVSADFIRSQIFVGCKDSKAIQVFNDRLERVNTVILPDPIGWPRCIAFSDDTLLVCDFDGKIACAVTMEGKLQFKFHLPSDKKCDRPRSVCTDENGFIYVLWIHTGSLKHSAVVVQHSQNDGHVLSERIVDGEARCITTVKQDQSENLLVATWKSANLYIYKLIQDDE